MKRSTRVIDPVYPSVHLVLHPSDLDQRLAIRHPVIRGAAGHYSTKALVESGKVALFLFFKRISSKVDTLINTVSSLHGLPSSLQSASAEPLVGICELRGKLRHFSTLNKRFGGIMRLKKRNRVVGSASVS
jgi:hypothetical protein